MKRALAVVALLAFPAFADVNLYNDNVKLGPVLSINCMADGGLGCARDAGSLGTIYCRSASTANRGCVDISTQSFAGAKTFTTSVTTPLVDAGEVAVGLMDLQGNNITGGSSSTLTVTSTTSDSVTTSTVPATKFKLGAAITSGDLGWSWEDSAGNQRMGLTGAGALNIPTVVSTTGAATVAGTNFSITAGAGGQSSGATPGGTGASAVITAGAGGPSAGAAIAGDGAPLQLYGGAGGADNGAFIGGQGGEARVTAGAGGPGQGGGFGYVFGGAGGAATGSHASGPGGNARLQGGAGGVGATPNGGSSGGGAIVLGGAGGDANTSTVAGAGGAASLVGGSAGAAGAGVGAAGGTVNIDTGASSGVAAAPAITIGTSAAGTITIGRSGKQIVANSYGLLTTHGTNLLAIEVNSGAMTAGELAATFATAFSVAPFCVCTHVNTTNTNACNIKAGSVPTTTTVTFAVNGGVTDVVHWQCTGQR